MNYRSVFSATLLLLILLACEKQIFVKSIFQDNAFIEVGNLSSGRYGHASVSFGNNIYIIGGFHISNSSFASSIETFNIENHSIYRLPTPIVPRRYLGAVLVDSNIYIIGGEKHPGDIPFNTSIISQSTGITEKYDLRTNELITLPAMPTPRQYMGVVAHNSKIYVIGGSHYKSFTSDHYRYISTTRYSSPYTHLRFLSSMEIYDTKYNTWIEGPPMPTARQCNAVLYKNNIYVVGGFNGHPLDNIEIFDIEKNEWVIHEDAPVSMSAHSCVENNGSIYIFGDYKELNRVLIYNIETGKWLNIESNFKSRRHNTAVCIDNNIYIVGGNISPFTDLSTIQMYKTM